MAEKEKKENKIPFYQVTENFMAVLNQATTGNSPLAKVIFGNHNFPHKFHVESSEEGIKIFIEELSDGVVRYVPEERVVDSLSAFITNLPADKFKAYKMDWDKARKVIRSWKAAKPDFPHEIKPILQKDTSGYTFHRLDFNMEEMETPTFDYLVEAIQTNGEAFMAYIGAMFDPIKTPQQYLWLSGSGGDGKGAIFRMLKKIFNRSYVSISTENRDVDKYWQSSLVGKRIAICGDTKNLDFINRSIFMQVSGGDPVSIRKMQKEAYTVELNCMFVFGANADPNISTEDSGKRRAIICHLDRDKYRFIKNLEEKLWLERSGIVQKCWDAWKKVRSKPMIPVDKESLAELGASTEEFQQQIFDRYLVADEGAAISSSDLITLLKENERSMFSNQDYGTWKRWLHRTYGVQCKRVRIDGGQKRLFSGIRDRYKETIGDGIPRGDLNIVLEDSTDKVDENDTDVEPPSDLPELDY